MLKNLCELEYKSQNDECRLLCNNNAPIAFLKEALFQFQVYISKIEEAAKSQQEAEKNKEQQQEPVVVSDDVEEVKPIEQL